MNGAEPQIEVGTSCWEAACRLLAAFDDSGVDDPTRDEDRDFRRWTEIEERTRTGLKQLPPREALAKDDAAIVQSAIGHGPVGWHAAAWAIDLTRHKTFSRPWIADREIVPAHGDLFPTCDWDVERRPLQHRMPRPWQTQRLKGELPHVRRFHESPERASVVFDGRWFDELAFLSGLESISLLAPNASLEDFDVPGVGFPIRLRDEADQTASIAAFVQNEVCEGLADLALVPELAGTEVAAGEVAAMMIGARRNAVVLAGTRHLTDRELRANVASLVLPSGDVVQITKRTPFWDADIREGISPCNEPIRVLVSADVRLAVLICKDFLIHSMLDAVATAGVNLVLVPSMSGRLDLHDVAARELAARSHALSVVANGPLEIHGEAPASAMIGRPEADPNLAVKSHRASSPGRVARFSMREGSYEERDP